MSCLNHQQKMTDALRIKLPLLEPRHYQIRVLDSLDSGCKRVVWLLHRRAGKDLTIWNWVIKKAMEETHTIFYILPTYSQAKKIIWEGMTKDGIRFIDYIPKEIIEKKSEAELSIRFTSGSLLQLLGSDNYDRLVGTNPSICVFSEFALQNPNGWEFIRPILAENNGTAIFISTPRGKNHFYDIFQTAEEEDDWFCERLTVNDTKAITKEAIEKERRSGMSDELIEQEFYCSFDIGVRGSYYGRSLRKMKLEDRICNVPYDENLLVYTAWDIGYSDCTSVIFFQKRGNELLIIDYYQNQCYHTSHYIQLLKSKEYAYGTHFIPHDGKSHNNTGSTFQQIARDLGVEMEVLESEKSIINGIERVRVMLSRVYIDKTKCEFLIRCMLQYHAEFNEKDNVYKNTAKHDWSSHACDALRYMAMVINELGRSEGTPTLEEYRRMKDIAERGVGRSDTVEEFFKPGW